MYLHTISTFVQGRHRGGAGTAAMTRSTGESAIGAATNSLNLSEDSTGQPVHATGMACRAGNRAWWHMLTSWARPVCCSRGPNWIIAHLTTSAAAAWQEVFTASRSALPRALPSLDAMLGNQRLRLLVTMVTAPSAVHDSMSCVCHGRICTDPKT